MSTPPKAEGNSVEVARIADAYARRGSGAERYSHFQPGNTLRLQEIHRHLLKVIGSPSIGGLEGKKILEIGCGSGYWLRQFIQWGARPENLTGVDLLPGRIAEAQKLCPSGVHLDCRDASHLDFGNGSFDVVWQATVFTSILESSMKAAIAGEMLRVLRPNGVVLWYDFFVNNPRNPDVRGIGKRELRELFPGCAIRFQRLTLAAPAGRILGRISRLAYELASVFPFTSTHYLALITKP